MMEFNNGNAITPSEIPKSEIKYVHFVIALCDFL